MRAPLHSTLLYHAITQLISKNISIISLAVSSLKKLRPPLAGGLI